MRGHNTFYSYQIHLTTTEPIHSLDIRFENKLHASFVTSFVYERKLVNLHGMLLDVIAGQQLDHRSMQHQLQ